MEAKEHTMLITIPTEVKDVLVVAANKDGRKLKPYVEQVVIKHAERKEKNKK